LHGRAADPTELTIDERCLVGVGGEGLEDGRDIAGLDELVPLGAEKGGLGADEVVGEVGAGEHVR